MNCDLYNTYNGPRHGPHSPCRGAPKKEQSLAKPMGSVVKPDARLFLANLKMHT